MKRLNGVLGGILVAGFFGFFTFGPAAAGDVVSSQQNSRGPDRADEGAVGCRPAQVHPLADLR